MDTLMIITGISILISIYMVGAILMAGYFMLAEAIIGAEELRREGYEISPHKTMVAMILWPRILYGIINPPEGA